MLSPQTAAERVRLEIRDKVKSQRRLMKVVKKLDKDESGALSKKEFLRLLGILGDRDMLTQEDLCAAVWEAVAGHTQRARGNTHHRVVELDVLAVSCWLGFEAAENSKKS